MSETNKQQPRDVISSIVATLPSLLQILAVVGVGFSEILNFESFLFDPKLLPLLNILSFVVSLGLIGTIILYEEKHSVYEKLYVFRPVAWFSKMFFVKRNSPASVEIGANDNSLNDRTMEMINRQNTLLKNLNFFLLFIQISSFSVFIYTLFRSLDWLGNPVDEPYFWLRLVQSISYSLMLVSSSGIIFLWLRNNIKKRSQFSREDFVPNFLNTLVSYGLIHNQVIIKSVVNQGQRNIVFCDLGTTPRRIITSYDGREIQGFLDDPAPVSGKHSARE